MCWPSFVLPAGRGQDGRRCRCTCRSATARYDLEALAAAVTAHPDRLRLQPQQPDRRDGHRESSGSVPRRRARARAGRRSTRPTTSTSTIPPTRTRSPTHVRTRPNVCVLRTFSKIYGLAGLRIGYAVAAPGSRQGLAQGAAAVRRQRAGPVAAACQPGRHGRDRAPAARTPPAAGARASFARLGRTAASGLHANFVCAAVGDAPGGGRALLAEGVIVRPLDRFGDSESIRDHRRHAGAERDVRGGARARRCRRPLMAAGRWPCRDPGGTGAGGREAGGRPRDQPGRGPRPRGDGPGAPSCIPHTGGAVGGRLHRPARASASRA